MISGSMKLSEVSVDEFIGYLKDKGYVLKTGSSEGPLKGVSGLAEFLGVCFNTAKKYVSDGMFDEAMLVMDGVTRFDRDKVREIARRRNTH